ncbi:MAG TPA: pyridoxamine 5'-phosphate oxidase family protein [Ramlibacter sp.]|nr:pyridoxamine 5'-phosphate oxidase family protein [Ramlibacter sp.]
MSPDPTKPFHESLWELIKDIRSPMFVHRHLGGLLHAHPLTLQNRSLKPDEPLYFFVSKKTELGQRLRVDGGVCVAFADPENDHFVSVSGHAVISDDMAVKRKLFNALAKAWFPGGADDPDLELVEVTIQDAEYWDVKESKTTQLLKIASAAISGSKPDLGEHREMKPDSTEPAPH